MLIKDESYKKSKEIRNIGFSNITESQFKDILNLLESEIYNRVNLQEELSLAKYYESSLNLSIDNLSTRVNELEYEFKKELRELEEKLKLINVKSPGRDRIVRRIEEIKLILDGER